MSRNPGIVTRGQCRLRRLHPCKRYRPWHRRCPRSHCSHVLQLEKMLRLKCDRWRRDTYRRYEDHRGNIPGRDSRSNPRTRLELVHPACLNLGVAPFRHPSNSSSRSPYSPRQWNNSYDTETTEEMLTRESGGTVITSREPCL